MRKRGEGSIRVDREPKLESPSLIAAWPGIANVALTAASYLADKLAAREFAEIEPLSYFDVEGTYVEANLIQLPRLPQNKFYYSSGRGSRQDLVIFVGEAQPASRNHQLANEILDFAQRLGVAQIYTFAAAIVPQFNENPRVWAAATDDQLLHELQSLGLVLRGNFYIAGMNGLLLSLAKERNMKGVCLLGETPRYLSEVGNPIASKSVLSVLAKLINVDIDLTELEQMVEQARQEIEEAIRESRRQYIDRFTVPLWERGEEDEKG